tara:strand:+ start:382 stop:489 length:108 start_codon:yes stop_codon:yes gene_type:complete
MYFFSSCVITKPGEVGAKRKFIEVNLTIVGLIARN